MEGMEISKCSFWKMEHDNYSHPQKELNNNTKNTKQNKNRTLPNNHQLLPPLPLAPFHVCELNWGWYRWIQHLCKTVTVF